MQRFQRPLQSLFAPLLACLLTSPARAVDLTVTSIEINQADQFGATTLIGDNFTWVRVKVGIAGSAVSLPGVDAVLRVFVDGEPYPDPIAPIYSLNGPITAPLSPANGNINDTLNFAVLPPVSSNVDFVVEVNPNRTVVETNYANNTLAVNDRNFECRKIVEIAYVAIDYTPGGGEPSPKMIEPGIGDGFVRSIYHPGEWNYHRAPFPPLVWTQPINNSNSALLNELKDMRINQIPDAGYPQPEFVYGWLPGNPFSGNGQAIGIPGDVAFGNTDSTRHQRTFAHELGHCFGLQHNNLTTNTVGIDTERHLKDTQNLAQLFPTTKKDIMVAGLLTNAAWVAQNTYTVVHNDDRMQCGSALAGEPAMMPLIRISGVIDHATNAITLNPATRMAMGQPSLHDPNGNTKVTAFDAAGNVLAQVIVMTGTTRERCTEHALVNPVLDRTSPMYVLLPEPPAGQIIQRIEVVDQATGKVMGHLERSPNAPQVAMVNIAAADAAMDVEGPLQGKIHVQWAATDPDGGALTHTLLYNPEGGRWLPLVVNTPKSSFTFDSSEVPASGAGGGAFKVITTDGLNIVESQVAQAAVFGANPPDVHLLTPNNNDLYPQLAPISLHASAWDLEDQMITGPQVNWSSNVDGPIGTGTKLVTDQLSPGTHIISVSAVDTTLQSAARQITITISPRIVVNPDCNGNGVLDEIDIANGNSSDSNGDGVPDECGSGGCTADITGDLAVDTDDLLLVINGWGPCDECTAKCGADLNEDCSVDVDDLLVVINAWGPCD